MAKLASTVNEPLDHQCQKEEYLQMKLGNLCETILCLSQNSILNKKTIATTSSW